MGTFTAEEVREAYGRISPYLDRTPLAEARRAAAKLLREEQIINLAVPETGADDFSFITDAVPASYFYVGLEEDPARPVVHHSAEFAWNDEVLAVSCGVLVKGALALLA